MSLHIRRGLVVTGVSLSLAVGLASIRVAAALTADAAPPPAPPVSMASLQAQLTAEQAGSAALQQQLDEVDLLTSQLSETVAGTSSDVSLDGLNAKQLRARLVAAQKKLATASRLLDQARAKLAAVNAAAPAGAPVAAPVETPVIAPVEAPVAPTVVTRAPEPVARAVPVPAIPTRTMLIAAKGGVAKRVETRQPLHIPVIAGISAGLYAGCLFVTSGLQFAADRELIADRQPMVDAIAILQQDHEAMTAALQAATDRYNEAVDGYGALTSDREALQARLARLGRQVATIEGITITGPSLDWSTAVAQSPSRSTTPKTSGGTSKGTTTTTGASGKP